jgi:hypothetical protein
VKRVLLRLGLLCMAIVLTLVGLELFVRVYYPTGAIPAAHLDTATAEQHTSVREDAEAGYLPILGQGEYDQNGVLKNTYQVSAKRGRRILFAGDSVTHRARLVKALEKLYGPGYEYWNAGVESFNTKQELVMYRRYNHKIKPDTVILTFHNNDFRATPLVVREQGKFKVYEPGMSINPWLFERSYLYRWAWPRTDDRNKRAKLVWESLREWKTLLESQKVELRIVLLPMFYPKAQWSKSELWSRDESIAYFKKLELPYWDMLEVVEKALAEGQVVTETAGDTYHPNDEICRRMAEQLYAQDLFPKN